jgi:hypothetical protein
MIQRKQSLYLLVAALILATLIFIPLGTLHNVKGAVFTFKSTGLYLIENNAEKLSASAWPILALLFVSFALIVFTIFQFKKRPLQMNLCMGICLIILALIGTLAYYLMRFIEKFGASMHKPYLLLLPIVAFILVAMAYKRIKKDEDLVRSVDRIR